jgi:hypothetical protein
LINRDIKHLSGRFSMSLTFPSHTHHTSRVNGLLLTQKSSAICPRNKSSEYVARQVFQGLNVKSTYEALIANISHSIEQISYDLNNGNIHNQSKVNHLRVLFESIDHISSQAFPKRNQQVDEKKFNPEEVDASANIFSNALTLVENFIERLNDENPRESMAMLVILLYGIKDKQTLNLNKLVRMLFLNLKNTHPIQAQNLIYALVELSQASGLSLLASIIDELKISEIQNFKYFILDLIKQLYNTHPKPIFSLIVKVASKLDLDDTYNFLYQVFKITKNYPVDCTIQIMTTLPNQIPQAQPQSFKHFILDLIKQLYSTHPKEIISLIVKLASNLEPANTYSFLNQVFKIIENYPVECAIQIMTILPNQIPQARRQKMFQKLELLIIKLVTQYQNSYSSLECIKLLSTGYSTGIIDDTTKNLMTLNYLTRFLIKNFKDIFTLEIANLVNQAIDKNIPIAYNSESRDRSIKDLIKKLRIDYSGEKREREVLETLKDNLYQLQKPLSDS